jgi:ATP-dependent helicase/nuclease subunit A
MPIHKNPLKIARSAELKHRFQRINAFLILIIKTDNPTFIRIFVLIKCITKHTIMEQHPQLLVYKASAGSGKTFTLAVQYIKLLIEDTSAYRKILAVTFTNKATTEMKKRILYQLYGIATASPESEGYLKEILKTSGKSVDEIRQAARTVLKNIIHDYSRFRIETIDSFFQSVMRNLSRELELGANLNIELNNTEVLSDAVDSMIEKLDRRSPVLYWLLEYIEERIADDKRWNVSGEIKNFGKNILNESYIEKGNGLRNKLSQPQFIPEYRKKLQLIRQEALEQMKGFTEHFLELLEANGLTPADLKRGSNGIASYFNKIARGELDDKVRNKTVEDCLEDAAGWTTKTSAYRDTIRSLAENELIPLLTEAEKLRPANNMLVNSCDLSLRYLNNLRLLAHIDEEVRIQNQSHNRFLLSDTNALLHSLIREGDASFVYEKIGTTIDTVMIDEFQDTSRMQWENFHLLLQESLAQKEGSLIVGDIKQSIYRWRNGDWKILAGLGNDPSFRIRECSLGTNWRSEANIIRFNNGLFTAACQVLNDRYEAEQGDPCTQLLDAYSDVCQQTARKDEKGYIKLTFLPDNKEEPYAETMLQQLAEETDALIRKGIQTKDIAILVRKNKTIPAIADYFDKHTPYRIVSDEAFRLDASLAICMIIDGLRFLAMPDDLIAQARLAVAYQNEILHQDISLNTILINKVSDYLPAGFMLQLEELKLMPLYELMEKLFILFSMERIEHQDAYLCAFYDAVTEYQQKHSSELTAFLTYWDEKLHEKTIPSGEIEGIRILSIHKSKGLEYHTVLIPFCDWKMENETNSHLIWCSVAGTGKETDIAPFNELDIVPVNYSSAMANSIYRSSYLEERLQLWVDNLNLLYVAFTRACKNLIIWGKQNQKGTVSELLQEALLQMKDPPMQYEETDSEEDKSSAPDLYEYGTLCLSEPSAEQASGNRLSEQAAGIPVRLESTETAIEFQQSNRSADFIRGEEEEEDSTQYIRQGRLLHQVFASIRQESDLPEAISRLRFDGILESAEQEKQITRLAQWAMNHPKVKDWYNGTWELFNECAILFTDENGQTQTRRPDRVMMKNGQVIIVDFKFGKKNEAYNRQVREYMNLLSAMGYTHVEGFLWYVFKNELEEIV